MLSAGSLPRFDPLLARRFQIALSISRTDEIREQWKISLFPVNGHSTDDGIRKDKDPISLESGLTRFKIFVSDQNDCSALL